MDARREINVFWSGIKGQILNRNELRKEARRIGEEVVEISRNRTDAGIGRNGKRFPGYSRLYRVKKRNMISGKWRFPRGSRVHSTFRARRVEDKVRLTGETFGSFVAVSPRVDVNENSVDLYIDVTTNSPRTRKRIGYLKGMGYDILGLATPGTTVGRAERRQILRNSKRRMQLNARAKGFVLEDER